VRKNSYKQLNSLIPVVVEEQLGSAQLSVLLLNKPTIDTCQWEAHSSCSLKSSHRRAKDSNPQIPAKSSSDLTPQFITVKFS